MALVLKPASYNHKVPTDVLRQLWTPQLAFTNALGPFQVVHVFVCICVFVFVSSSHLGSCLCHIFSLCRLWWTN